jgi:hypothetical protein
MAAAAFAKLLWLEAKEVRDPDSADEIVVSSGGLQFERIRMRKDDVCLSSTSDQQHTGVRV